MIWFSKIIFRRVIALDDEVNKIIGGKSKFFHEERERERGRSSRVSPETGDAQTSAPNVNGIVARRRPHYYFFTAPVVHISSAEKIARENRRIGESDTGEKDSSLCADP